MTHSLSTSRRVIPAESIEHALDDIQKFLGEFSQEAVAFDTRGRTLFGVFLDVNNAGRMLLQAYKNLLQLNSEVDGGTTSS